MSVNVEVIGGVTAEVEATLSPTTTVELIGGTPGLPGPEGPAGPMGPEAPQGDPGPVSGVYVHTQSLPSAMWIIVHGLSYNPNITTVDSAGSQVEGDVTYSAGMITVEFSAAFGGVAYLSQEAEMSRKFLTALDLVQNELQNARVQNLAAAPTSPAPVEGQLYMNTTDDVLYWYNGSGWVAAQGGAGAVPATTVTTQAIGDAAVVGTETEYAREDHKHGMPAFGSVTAETSFGLSSGNGSSAAVAHTDHTHGTPTHDNAAHSAITLNSLATPTADVSMGGFNITNLDTPGAASDAVTKAYVDNAIAGLSWKETVRVATTANSTLASTFENGDTIDGVVLATGNRILIKDQSTGAENGIYTVNASGAPTRALDADAVGELEGAAVFVTEGTANGDKAFTCTTNGTITPGSTATTWAQFGAGTAYTAGNGLTLSGSDFNVIGDSSITVTADLVTRAALTGDVTAAASSNATTIAADVVSNTKLANMAAHTFKGNNTGSTADPLDLTITELQTELGVLPATLAATYVKLFAADCAAATTTVVTHNFNTRDVKVEVYRTTTPWDTVDCDVERTTVNSVTVGFASAPTAAQYRIVVEGIDQ